MTSETYRGTGSVSQLSPTGVLSTGGYISYVGFWQPILAVIAKGDINGDEVIDLADAIIVLQALVGIDAYPVIRRADLNRDCKISTAEVIFVFQHICDLRPEP